jgi:hypothetical protein
MTFETARMLLTASLLTRALACYYEGTRLPFLRGTRLSDAGLNDAGP